MRSAARRRAREPVGVRRGDGPRDLVGVDAQGARRQRDAVEARAVLGDRLVAALAHGGEYLAHRLVVLGQRRLPRRRQPFEAGVEVRGAAFKTRGH